MDNKHEESDQNFHVWVKGKLKSVNHNAVTLDKIVVMGKFECEKKQKICDDNIDALKNRFRGSKTITLKKEDHWLIVPNGETSGVSSIKHQEEIAKALGLEKDIPERSVKKQEPNMMKSDLVVTTLNSIYMSEDQRSDVDSIITRLVFDPLFKVISAKEILEVFNSKASVEQDIESKLCTLNVMLEVLGKSSDPERENSYSFNAHWKKVNKQKAKAFLFAYSAIFDKLTSNMETLEAASGS